MSRLGGDKVAVARLRFLSKDDEELVHEQSLKCLNEIGVLIRSHSVLGMLEEGGAAVDRKSGIAKISESMVKEALSRAPRSIRLCARDKASFTMLSEIFAM